MSIIRTIGPDSVSRLEKAAERRCAEADCLDRAGHRLGALYFYGYAIEIAIGIAYFKMIGFGSMDPILPKDLKRALVPAASHSLMSDKSHPIDGWVLLLIDVRARLYPPAYEKRLERKLKNCSLLVRESWSPKLRYRAMEIGADQVAPVRESAHWLLKNSHKL